MTWLARLAIVVVTAYAALCGLLYLLQDRLIFLPRPLAAQPAGPHVDSTEVRRGDATLRGWIVNGSSSGPLLIYFGGNAEELSGLVDVFARLPATAVLVNYRGYGNSDGLPSAAALTADARALVEVMRQRHGQQRPLILFGRSLGSGIAVQAAAAADALVLMSPYRSLTDVAQHIVPMVPVGLLLRHRIDATAHLADIPQRTLVFYGVSDRIVPTEESRALVELLGAGVRVRTFDASHNVPLTDPAIWPHLRRFVAGTGERLDRPAD